jgi:hypothetical protein
MGSTSCPQCGGQVKVETVGRLRDKVLKCPYCAHTCDVPDEYEVTREEVHEGGPGHVRRVRVTERCSDASPAVDLVGISANVPSA